MANYSVHNYSDEAPALAAILAKLETKLETIENTKTIRLIEVHQVGGAKWQYALVADA